MVIVYQMVLWKELMNKTIFRLSFGSRNFTRMRNRIMYVINDNNAILYERKKKANKYKGKPRGPYNKNKQK